MKTISLTVLLYGRDYLGYALRSVIDAVDEAWVLYTPTGSQGHRESTPCPETRDELYAIAKAAAGDKLRWHEGIYAYEGQHRDTINQLVPDADVILVVDADEVWSERLAPNLINDYATMLRLNGHPWEISRLRIPIIHYWRSFHQCVLHDPAFPERIIFPKATGGHVGTASIPRERPIHHFGYAQHPEIVRWKWENTHGHKLELRRDLDWFRDKFMANAQSDCHPVGSDYWNPEPVDPFALGLPEWMREHEYANKEVIGEVIR